MSVLRAIAEVFAHAPLSLLLGGALMLVIAWWLRRRHAAGQRQRGALGARVGCVLLALAMLGIAVRRGALAAARARRTAALADAADDARSSAQAQLREDLGAWRACEPPATEVTTCADVASRLLGNPYCTDECVARLRKRPDVMPVAEDVSHDAGLD